MELELVTPPTTEPLSLAEAKAHAVIPEDLIDDDVLLGTYLTAAREYCEQFTSRVFAEATYRQIYTGFPGAVLCAYRAPVASWGAFEYLGLDGTTWTPVESSLYYASTASARIVLNNGLSWPTPFDRVENVRVTYTAAPSAAVPQSVLQAIRLLFTEFCAHREASMTTASVLEAPFGVRALLGPHIRRW